MSRKVAVAPAGRTWAEIEEDMDASISATAEEGKDDKAFKRFVKSALNGETAAITGWQSLDTHGR